LQKNLFYESDFFSVHLTIVRKESQFGEFLILMSEIFLHDNRRSALDRDDWIGGEIMADGWAGVSHQGAMGDRGSPNFMGVRQTLMKPGSACDHLPGPLSLMVPMDERFSVDGKQRSSHFGCRNGIVSEF